MIEFIIGGVVVLIILIIIIAAALGAFSAPSAGAPAGYSPPSSTGGGSGLTIPPPPSPPSGSSGSGSGSTSGTTASVPPVAPPPKPTCTGMSTFYKDKNYGGKSISLGKGYHDVTEIKNRLKFNDKISSWKLAPNCAAKMYKDDHRGGTVWQVPPLPAENPWVGKQINDKITEIEISDAM